MTVDVPPPLSVPEVQHISGEARLSHDGWVSEFEAFQWSAEARNSGVGGSKLPAVLASARSGHSGRSAATKYSAGGCGGSGNPSKTMDNLRAEIKLLHWHKLANEAALKAALLKTKKNKAQGVGSARPVLAMSTLAMSIDERAAWMQQVIEEEKSKPLQVTKDFVSKYEEQERETEGRLDSEVAGHIRSLRNLRKQIEKREEMKKRRAKYRAAHKDLGVEKERLQLGKFQPKDEPISAQLRTRLGQDRTGGQNDKVGEVSSGFQQGSQQTVGPLNTVLGSLDKLVELEKRITSLEKSNIYDDFRATKQAGGEPVREHAQHSAGRRSSGGGRVAVGDNPALFRTSRGKRNTSEARRGRLSFSKQRTEATTDTPSQVYYAVRVRNHGVGSTSSQRTLRRSRPFGQGVGIGGMRPRAVGAPSGRARGARSTFLTQLPEVHCRSRAASARAPGGGASADEGFRSAVAEKKRLEAKRKIDGNRAEAARIARQDSIIREWLQRKKAAAAAGQRQRKSSVLSGAGSTIAGGVSRRTRSPGLVAPRRVTNTHLQEFRDIRAQYAKRTEKLRRDLSYRRRGPELAPFVTGTRTPSIARPGAIDLTAASTTPARPTVLPRPRGGIMRGPGVRGRAAAVGYRLRARGARRGVGVAVGGIGLRAARARGSRNVSGGGSSSTYVSGSRRRDGSWRQREREKLPRVSGVGRRAVGR